MFQHAPDVREQLHDFGQLHLQLIWVDLLVLHQVVAAVREQLRARHFVAGVLALGRRQCLIDEDLECLASERQNTAGLTILQPLPS